MDLSLPVISSRSITAIRIRQQNVGRTESPPSSLSRTTALYQQESDDDMYSKAQQDIEGVLEGISKQGAHNLSSVSLAERTKRALLAEQVEDQIFANIYELEQCNTAKDAKMIISQTRNLRRQYDELVSGEGSSMLNTMEAAMVDDRTDEDDEADASGKV